MPPVFRFAPSPNGYLHLGHATSICLNFGLTKKYPGYTNLRFDDTNPSKEETEYVDAIKEPDTLSSIRMTLVAAVFAVLALTVVRMAPVALVLIRSRLDRSTVAFVGWFGPRGLASVVFALVAASPLRHGTISRKCS